MTLAAQSTSPSGIALRWYVLITMTMVYAINIADRYVASTVLEPIRREFHLSDFAVALMTGGLLALFYVSISIPVSALADRSNRRTVVAVSLAWWSIMTTLCGYTQNIVQLVAARIGVGIGESGATPASTALISDYFRPLQRPMAMTVFTLGAPIGAWLGSDLAGKVAGAHGWRAAFLVLGIPGIVLGGLIMLTVREPQRAVPVRRDTVQRMSLFATVRALFGNRAAVHLMMGGAIAALWGWGLIWWTPTYFNRSFGLTVDQAGAALGHAHLIAGASVALLIGPLMATRWMQSPSRIMGLMAAVVGLSTIPSALMLLSRSPQGALTMVWLFLPAIYFYIGPSIGVLQNAVPNTMRAQATAITVLMGNITNLLVAPLVVGWISDTLAGHRGTSAASLRTALLLLSATGLWSAYHFWASARCFAKGAREQTTAEP